MFDDLGQPSLLSAVNYILRAYGSAEVSRLKETKDAASAEEALKLQLITLLSVGYNFCKSRGVTLHTDSNSYIFLPANCLKVDVDHSYSYLVPVKRGNRMYSLALNSFEFPVNIKADIINYVPYDELPSEAATLVCTQAAINFIGDRKPDDPALRNLDRALTLAKVNMENMDHTVSEYRPPMYDNWRS